MFCNGFYHFRSQTFWDLHTIFGNLHPLYGMLSPFSRSQQTGGIKVRKKINFAPPLKIVREWNTGFLKSFYVGNQANENGGRAREKTHCTLL